MDLTGPGRAGPQRHGAGASRAEGEPGQKDWSSDGAGRIDPRIAIFQNRLDPIEKRWVNNDRRRNNDVLRRHFFGSRFRVHLIEPQFAHVGCIGQHRVYGADPPIRALARPITVRVQPDSDGLDAHRSRSTVTLKVEVEGQPDNFSLN